MEEEECVILLTGFGPFDPHSLNLSSKIAEELDGAQFLTINSFQNSNSQEEATLKAKVHTTVIPVCYQKAKKVVLKLLESYLQESNEELCCKKSKKLKAFILLGIHPGKEIKLETRAKNGGVKRRDIEDYRPINDYCIEGAEDELVTTLDLNSICDSLKKENYNVTISDDAGNFLCNYTYFITQYYIKSKSKKDAQTRIPSLFVHIPCDEVTYSLQELRRAVQVIIENVLKQVCELEANEHNK